MNVKSFLALLTVADDGKGIVVSALQMNPNFGSQMLTIGCNRHQTCETHIVSICIISNDKKDN